MNFLGIIRRLIGACEDSKQMLKLEPLQLNELEVLDTPDEASKERMALLADSKAMREEIVKLKEIIERLTHARREPREGLKMVPRRCSRSKIRRSLELNSIQRKKAV